MLRVALLLEPFDHGVHQVVDRRVAHRRHPHPQAGVDERADHVRAGERLAGARRPLDRHVAPIEPGDPAADRVDVADELATVGPVAGYERREVAAQDRMGDPVGAARQHLVGQFLERVQLRPLAEPLVVDERRRVHALLGGVAVPGDRQLAGVGVDLGHREEHPLLLVHGDDQLRAAGDLDVDRLGREREARPRPLRRLAVLQHLRLESLERQPGDRRQRLQLVGLVRDRQAVRVGVDDQPLATPVAEQVAHQMLDRAGPERVERLDAGVEFGVGLLPAEHGRPPRHPGRALVTNQSRRARVARTSSSL